MVDHGIAGFVEARRKVRLGDGHAHGVGKSLSEWAGGSLNTLRLAVFVVAGRSGAELTEILYVVHRNIVAE